MSFNLQCVKYMDVSSLETQIVPLQPPHISSSTIQFLFLLIHFPLNFTSSQSLFVDDIHFHHQYPSSYFDRSLCRRQGVDGSHGGRPSRHDVTKVLLPVTRSYISVF